MSAINGSATFDGTPPASHDLEGSPSTNNINNNNTPVGQGDGSGAPYVPVQNGRKRKADGTSSRGVANLTPEQLAKKRANDREAQRAIRERTKNTIENLERRIKELESQQPFQELQNVIRVRDAIQAENEELKRRMQSILGLLQPSAASQGLNGQSQHSSTHMALIALADGSDLAAATARQSPLPMGPPPQAHMYQPHQPQQSHPTHSHQLPPHPLQQQLQQHQLPYEHSFPQQHLHPDLRNNNNNNNNNSNHPSPSPQRPLPPPGNGHGQRWSPSTHTGSMTNQFPQQQQQQQHHTPAPYPSEQTQQQQQQQQHERFGLQQLVDDHLKASNPSPTEARRRDLVPTSGDEPLWKRLPLNVEPTCTLDGILKGFEAERRRAAQSGASTATLLGPAYPSISSLLNHNRSVNSHPLSKVFTDILSKFSSISDVPEQVAVLYIMFLIMRWHIAPTPENYERLPEWVRPVRSQLDIAHPAWIDHLPWPMMRDRIIRAQSLSTYPFESFFVPYTTTLSLNWPYEQDQCLLRTSRHGDDASTAPGATESTIPPRTNSNDATNAIESAVNGSDDGDEFVINPIFESHLRNLDNWSLGTAFRNTFPDLVDDVRVKDVKPPTAQNLV